MVKYSKARPLEKLEKVSQKEDNQKADTEHDGWIKSEKSPLGGR